MPTLYHSLKGHAISILSSLKCDIGEQGALEIPLLTLEINKLFFLFTLGVKIHKYE
jgi:hypothetical protein